MKLIKNILDFLVIIPLFIFSLIKILLYVKKINSAEIIITQNKGGFGYNFTTPDIMRNFYTKRKLFVWFFEPIRHNIYIKHFFDFDFLILNLSFSIKINKRFFIFGDYEGKTSRAPSNILIYLIKILSKKHSKIFKEIELYNQLNKLNVTSKNSNEAWKNVYFRKVKKNNYNLKLNSIFFNKIDKLFKFKNYKKINLYLRNKGSEKNMTEYMRSGGNEKIYHKTIEYLLSKKYIILITGDTEISKKFKNKYPELIFDANDFKNKNKISLYFASISDYAIVEPGGGFWFGIYKKKLIKINAFPYGIFIPGNKILYKDIFKIKNNTKMKKNWCLKNFKFKYYHPKYKIMVNSSDEIFKFVKKYF